VSISNFGAAGVKPGVCTSTTRPSTPYTGQIIFETDTGLLRVWDGSIWDYINAGPKEFATEAARNSAINTLYEGVTAYVQSSTEVSATGAETFLPAGITTVYDGSNWVCTTPVSARTTTSGTVDLNPWVALTGGGTAPTVSVRTGTKALVTIQALANCSVASTQMFYVGVVVTGASSIGPNPYHYAGRASAVSGSDQTINGSFVVTGLTPGINTFGLQYGRTNVGGAVTFSYRSITAAGLL
jgi:hypothetical protein